MGGEGAICCFLKIDAFFSKRPVYGGGMRVSTLNAIRLGHRDHGGERHRGHRERGELDRATRAGVDRGRERLRDKG